jgi:hypothetical protein
MYQRPARRSLAGHRRALLAAKRSNPALEREWQPLVATVPAPIQRGNPGYSTEVDHDGTASPAYKLPHQGARIDVTRSVADSPHPGMSGLCSMLAWAKSALPN